VRDVNKEKKRKALLSIDLIQ